MSKTTTVAIAAKTDIQIKNRLYVLSISLLIKGVGNFTTTLHYFI